MSYRVRVEWYVSPKQTILIGPFRWRWLARCVVWHLRFWCSGSDGHFYIEAIAP